MSRQLTLSASICAAALAVLAVVTSLGMSDGGSEARPATAHGSLISVLLRT